MNRRGFNPCDMVRHAIVETKNGILGLMSQGQIASKIWMEMVVAYVTLCYDRERYLSNTEKYGVMDIGGGTMVLGGISPPADMVFAHSDPICSTYYNTEMKEIHVAGKRLALFPGTFDRKHGTILDSGTTYAYLPEAAFKAYKDDMDIPNVLLSHLKITPPCLCWIFLVLQHMLWPFPSLPIALGLPPNVIFPVVQLSRQWAMYLLLQAFIYPRQTAFEPILLSHNSFLANSQLVHHFHPMENTTISYSPKTRSNIEIPSSFQYTHNQERSSMIYAQNDQQTDSIPSASFMPLTHLHPASYYPQLHNQTQLVLSNALARDMPQGACYMQPLGISELEEQRKLYLSTCKAARAKRMMERQVKFGRHLKSSGGHTSCSSSISQNGSNGFGTPNNKELRFLLQKKLTSSDVGSNGRIILPKKKAERSLPNLSSREGIMVVIRDVHSNHGFRMRYGFWENHKGRMYILDQCGGFVNQNDLATGDILTLYEDERKELYVSIQKTRKPTPTPTLSNDQNNSYYTYTRTPFSEQEMEEENSSLQILMKELTHTEQLDANNLDSIR